MATIEITGRVVKDVALERTPNGKEITSFSIASNRKYTDDKGKQHDEVDFYHITCWKDLAVATQFLKKGNKIRVRGFCQYKNWVDQDEVPRTTFEVTATDISMSIFTIFANMLKKKDPEHTIGARTYEEPEAKPPEEKTEQRDQEKQPENQEEKVEEPVKNEKEKIEPEEKNEKAKKQAMMM